MDTSLPQQTQSLPQLFGIIPTGHPPITAPSSAPTSTSVLYALPALAYSHIVVFLLPGISLPPNTAAAVYLQLPSPPSASGAAAAPEFKFLGGIGPGKESAVFRIRGPGGAAGGGEAIVGISIEDASAVTEKMAGLPASTAQGKAAGGAGGADTVVLAQRIIKNAFNFLAGFSGNTAGGVEVVPLKAFEEWWKKFEGRVRADPGFLERDGE